MLYSELEDFIIKEVIKDRAFQQDNHLLNILNLALPRFAADYNTIDPDFYYKELRTPMTFGVSKNLGVVNGFAGAIIKSAYGNDIILSEIGQGNKTVRYGIKTKENEDDELVVELVNNETYPLNIDTSDVLLCYMRKPEVLTGVPTQYVDMPSRYKYEISLLVKHFYYETRMFLDEANMALQKYNMEMNKIIKRSKPGIFPTDVGRTPLPKTYYRYR